MYCRLNVRILRYLCGIYVKKDVVGGLLALLYFREELLQLTGLGILNFYTWLNIIEYVFFRYSLGKNFDAFLFCIYKYLCLCPNQASKQQVPISVMLGV